MKSLPKRLVPILIVLATIIAGHFVSCLPPAQAESEASSAAGTEAGLEAGTPGRGRRGGGRRAYWRRMRAQANKEARKEEQHYRATKWTGDHH